MVIKRGQKSRRAYGIGRGLSIVLRTTSCAPRNGKQHLLAGLVFLLLVISACGGDAGGEPGSPTIHYGEDICTFCGMIITEERYAAGYITADRAERTFDDLGDMVQYHLDNPEEVIAFFVHDHESGEWIRGESAHYALSGDLPTPMLSGLAAFPSAEKAAAFAVEFEGDVLTFNELLTHYRDNPPTPLFSDLATE